MADKSRGESDQEEYDRKQRELAEARLEHNRRSGGYTGEVQEPAVDDSNTDEDDTPVLSED